jgi:hypothetical protein
MKPTERGRERERAYTVDGGGTTPAGRPNARWWRCRPVVLRRRGGEREREREIERVDSNG